MGLAERDRRDIINKLKKIKDPHERDRLLWLLADQEKSFLHGPPTELPAPRALPGLKKTAKPAVGRTPPRSSVSGKNVKSRRMLGLVIPAFFLVFGLIHIGRAVLNYLATGAIETEIPRLITGGIFVLIGLAGIYQATRPRPLEPDEAS